MGIDDQNQLNDETLSMEERIALAIRLSKEAIPNDKKRGTDRQIALAVMRGFNPINLVRSDLRRLLNETTDHQMPLESLEARKAYLVRILPKGTSIDLGSLTNQDIGKLIRERHDQLEIENPAGTSISFEKDGERIYGVISTYCIKGLGRGFAIRGRSGTFSFLDLASAERLHDVQDPDIVAKDQLRTRINDLVKKYFDTATFTVDISVDGPKTQMAVMNKWKKRNSIPTDEEIMETIEKLRGETY